MARKLDDSMVYPPRYFVGHVDIRPAAGGPVRIRFENAPLFPMTERTAMIHPGKRLEPYYCAVMTARDFPAGWVYEIQYAISVFDARTGRPRIEKFNHPFDHPGSTVITRKGCALFLESDRPLFRVYRLPEVMAGFAGSSVPVIQFIA